MKESTKRANPPIQDMGNRMALKMTESTSVSSIVERAKQKGWKSISVEGDFELRRATWFEARVAGLEVKGYQPTRLDQELLSKMEDQKKKFPGPEILLTGREIVRDYDTRVVPQLKKEFDSLSYRRHKMGITTSEMDRVYGINVPSGYAREIDEKFDRARRTYERALESRDFFSTVANQKVSVKFLFEDGVARFISNPENKDLNRGNKEQFHSLGRKL